MNCRFILSIESRGIVLNGVAMVAGERDPSKAEAVLRAALADPERWHTPLTITRHPEDVDSTPRPAGASDTTAPTVNRFGHVWGRGLPLDDGYARCTATVCRARENTPEAASPCQGSVAKPAVKPVLMVAPDPAPAAVIGAVMTALARPAEEA